MPSGFWCECDQPAGSGLERCRECGGICPPTPEQDRETADALAEVILGKRLKSEGR